MVGFTDRAVYIQKIYTVCEEGFVRPEGVEGVDCSPEGKLAGFRIKLDILTATSGRTEWRCPRVAERMRELDTESPVVWPAWCYTGESIVEHFFYERILSSRGFDGDACFFGNIL